MNFLVRSFRKNALPLLFALWFCGCSENKLVDPHPPKALASTTEYTTPLNASADSIAWGLALALRDPTIRMAVVSALRASTFRMHAVRFIDFCRSEQGSRVCTKAGASLHLSAESYQQMASVMPQLVVVMPRILDRLGWDGSEEVNVVGTSESLEQLRQKPVTVLNGYDSQGQRLSISTNSASGHPVLAVVPLQRLEGVLVARTVVRSELNTVSNALDERMEMIERGRDRLAQERLIAAGNESGVQNLSASAVIAPCPDGGCDGDLPPYSLPVGGGGATLPAYMTMGYCFGWTNVLDLTTDADNDRIKDDCEVELASRLSPLLNIGFLDRNPQRQSYWSASRDPSDDSKVQMFFAIGYLNDGGDFSTGWGSHIGDSEFIILQIATSSGSTWGVRYATLSAHYGSWIDDTSTYYWDDLQFPGGAYPRIWASLDKHGNYRNRAACEGSAGATCQNDYWGYRIPATGDNNLGNYFHVPESNRTPVTQLHNCVLLIDPFPTRTAEECFWTDQYFDGWSFDTDHTTGYRTIVEIFGF